MRIERLSQDKIRIFLTFDDLSERGIQKEDMWQEVPKVHDLFTEMMDQAYSELGFDATGPLAVEVFALPAQGMVVIVTRGKYDHHQYGASGEEELPEEIYEMEVTLEQSDSIVYAFRDFEVLVEAAHVLIGNITSQGNCILITINGICTSIQRNLKKRRCQVLLAYLLSLEIPHRLQKLFSTNTGRQ